MPITSFDAASAALGSVRVVTSSDGGHPPEFWAERCAAKIISLSDDPCVPEPIRAQARAFQAKVQETVLLHIKEAIRSDRARMALLNRKD